MKKVLTCLFLVVSVFSQARLLCPVCQKKHMESQVRSTGCSSTLMYCDSYYDEKGVYHDNSGCNQTTCTFGCSRGHVFIELNKSSEFSIVKDTEDDPPPQSLPPPTVSPGTVSKDMWATGTNLVMEHDSNISAGPVCSINIEGLVKGLRRVKETKDVLKDASLVFPETPSPLDDLLETLLSNITCEKETKGGEENK